MENRPALVFTTDVNGTTTPDNTFARLVEADGRADEMARLMDGYTTGRRAFSQVLGPMEELAGQVTRERLTAYAKSMPLFPEVEPFLSGLAGSSRVHAAVALSTTGFGGLMALINRFQHHGRLLVAASPVLLDLLHSQEKQSVQWSIRAEADKVGVLRELIRTRKPLPGLVFHAGDTMGDFPAIRFAAEAGGAGIAFCPNAALEQEIRSLPKETGRKVAVIQPHAQNGPDYGQVAAIVRQALWDAAREEI